MQIPSTQAPSTNGPTVRSTDHPASWRPGRRLAVLPLAALVALVPVACSSDDEAAQPLAAAESTTSTPATSSTHPEGHDEPQEIEVTLTDFQFSGLPESAPAGSKLTIVNEAVSELHELVAFRLPDDEERSVEELVSLPQAEVGPMLGAPVTVLLAPPGGEQIAAVGDGTLAEPGRYAIICSIPTGVAPETYLKAAAASNGAPPEVEGGPPHLVHGMFAELVVT